MLDLIIRFSIRNKLIIGIFTLALICWGSYSVTQLPIDAVPDITNNQVQIITNAPSQSALDIERLVTFPIEQAVATIPGIEEVRSFSRFGLSVVTIVFKETIDIDKARQKVFERLGEATDQIPKGVGTPKLGPVTTGLGEIYQYTIHPEPGYESKYNAMDLRTIQDWIVKRQLLDVDGIADISSFGGYLKQYEVALDPNKLKSMNITIADVFTALEKNNQNTGGAYIDKKPYAFYVHSEGLIESKQDIENIVVKNTDNGLPVLISNIGEVKLGHAIRYGALTYNDKGEVVGGIVMMLKGENSSKVIANVTERVKQIQESLPKGVVIEPFLDRTKLVNNAIGTVTKNLLEGALIVIFILVLFLGNFRAGLIVASVIPLAMLFAISLMNVFGVSGNLMSLGAIDFGLIIDGAVIIVEATMHHLSKRNFNRKISQHEMDEEVFQSATKIRTSAAFGEIIILIVYLPILTLVGIEGKMFAPMAQTVSFAILGAFILSLTYVPMMGALCLNKNIREKKTVSDRMMNLFQRIYTPAITGALKKPLLVISTSVILFVLSVLLFGKLGAEFLPSLDEGDFAVETRVMTGSSLSETIDAATKGSKILLERFPDEVKEVVGKIGSGEIPTDPMPIEACDLMVILNDKSDWKKALNNEELAELMAKELEDISGVTFGFQQPIQMRFNELMTGARQDVVVKVFGENLDLLSSYAGKIAKIVAKIDGAKDLYVEQVTGLPQIVIKYKRDQIAKYGMNIEDINTSINTAFAGQSAGLVFEDEKRFDLVVRFDPTKRASPEDVKSLYVTTPNGQQIPLEQVADVDTLDGPNQVQRDDAKRRIIIGFNVRGRDVESIITELKAKIKKEIKFEPGYYPTYGGTFENLQQARARLMIAVPVALLLILLLLYFTFSSLKQSLFVYSAIPLSAIGGVLALWLRDMPFSISAGVGFIALFGVAVLNGIVLIAEFNRLKKDGMQDIRERIISGASTRLRPVIMTAAVASFGFLPMALSTGSGAEVQKPLATVVIGGLLTATLLTLLVLPCIYLLADGGSKRKTKTREMKTTTIALLLFFCGSLSVSGQTKSLNLDSALSIAYRNNINLQAVALKKDYYQLQKKTSGELPKTDVLLTYGQYNSFYKKDNNLTVSQTIPFPTVFGTKSSLAQAHMKSAELQTAVTKNELTYRVKQTYYSLVFWEEYKRLLLTQIEAYTELVKAADLRYKTGEGNLLVKTAAETRQSGAQNKLRQTDGEIQVQYATLKNLLGVDYDVTLENKNDLIRNVTLAIDSTAIASNPQLALVKQQIDIAQKEKSVISSSALPEFKFGYFNQSLYGVPLNDANTRFAGSGNRFQGFQFGIAIPLWFAPQANKNKVAQKQIEINELNYKNEQAAITTLYQQSSQRFIRSKSDLDYYENIAMVNAGLIEKQSKTAFAAGDIGHGEHLLNLQQTIDIKESYLNATLEYNLSVIYLEYLMAR